MLTIAFLGDQRIPYCAMPTVHNSSKTGLELAKDYWNNSMSASKPCVAFVDIQPSDTNVYAVIIKDNNVGRIELMAKSNGNKKIYNRGYSDTDFVEIQ